MYLFEVELVRIRRTLRRSKAIKKESTLFLLAAGENYGEIKEKFKSFCDDSNVEINGIKMLCKLKIPAEKIYEPRISSKPKGKWHE